MINGMIPVLHRNLIFSRIQAVFINDHTGQYLYKFVIKLKKMLKTNVLTEAPPPKGRLIIGGGLFFVGFLCPLLIPFVVDSELSAEWKTILSATLLIGIPELFLLAAVAVLGKPGYNYLKGKCFSLFKKAAPADTVSHTRYQIGLVMFLSPIIFGWIAPYLTEIIPFYQEYQFLYNVAGDVMLIGSLFVLGGDFWDKLRALFIHNAKVQLSGPEPNQGLKDKNR